ncbi:GNAT family N-acetyltransferase [Roseomonas sp. M0104]|uniref:GNAT family N-acetyltransferase n=1 Tax=Teichococcus coralli TaxID=2545983 RepID=A0A845BLN2_9PROT|nr:GNAT family N-acetyltransferase [Pseudoroseomonas coralli]MXP64319.1 GNAT family N-acetyltransferase [Pseudoroseomonas coralli]
MSPARPILPAELPALLALNNRHAPAVNALTLPEFAALAEGALLALAAWEDREARALLLAFGPAGPARGPNHAWIRTHAPGAAYVDRIVVDGPAQGRGLGRALYGALAERAAACGLAELGCEVNLAPPNPESLAFHARLGFRRLGEATDPRNGKRVAYLGCPAAQFLRSAATSPLSGGARLNTSQSQSAGASLPGDPPITRLMSKGMVAAPQDRAASIRRRGELA